MAEGDEWFPVFWIQKCDSKT